MVMKYPLAAAILGINIAWYTVFPIVSYHTLGDTFCTSVVGLLIKRHHGFTVINIWWYYMYKLNLSIFFLQFKGFIKRLEK